MSEAKEGSRRLFPMSEAKEVKIPQSLVRDVAKVVRT
jgi:hypothetical protein